MKFDYGQQVIYKPLGSTNVGATKLCSVVAITPVETLDQAKAFGYPQGTVMYTVEFGDGTDEFVPEDDLQLV
jgi:hypothetical protein